MRLGLQTSSFLAMNFAKLSTGVENTSVDIIELSNNLQTLDK